jgi:nucleoside-diphosphate-sugar epimerase
MRILVTGSRGIVGRAASTCLESAGDRVIDYDLAGGQDVLDARQVREAASACDVIVHLAAVDDQVDEDVPLELLPPSQGPPERVMAVTVLGTWNVLEAARSAGHERVVVMSSVDALGIFMGQREPDYLPIDNRHPTYPRTPYGLAKRTAERMCRTFTETTGIATICLRPPGIWTEEIFDFIRKRWAEDPMNDRRPFWEYGAFIALSDVAEAVRCAVHHPFTGHATLHLSADDAALAEQTSRQAAQTIHPGVPWRGGPEFEDEPFRTLLENQEAKSMLGWRPRVRFRPIDARADEEWPR